MELNITPSNSNQYPLSAFIIKSSSPFIWLKTIQSIQCSHNDVKTYPIPGTTPNSIWGCLIVPNDPYIVKKHHQTLKCQLIEGKIFIPEYATLIPVLRKKEIAAIFSNHPHLFHPEIGLTELSSQVVWQEILTLPAASNKNLLKPKPHFKAPTRLKSLQIQPEDAEETLQKMEEEIFPKRKSEIDTPLSTKEKLKLKALKTLFKPSTDENNKPEKTTLGKFVEKISNIFQKDQDNKLVDQLEKEFEDLETRNRKNIQKLLNLFEKDPEEALKYALPLNDDNIGTDTPEEGAYNFSKIRDDFSLNASNHNHHSGTGRAIALDDNYYTLKSHYENTAKQLIQEGKYDKAAFVYLKLLNKPEIAAQVLKDGALYKEAAAIYLFHLNKKKEAAICYEEGHFYQKALKLYKEIEAYETVGDLYLKLNQQEPAYQHYQLEIDRYISKKQHLEAGDIYRNKMLNESTALETYLKGWRKSNNGYNCLKAYFQFNKDEKGYQKKIWNVYHNHVDQHNNELFLKNLKYEFKKETSVSKDIRDIAYEIIAEKAKQRPMITSELIHFNKKNKTLLKDTFRYKQQKRY